MTYVFKGDSFKNRIRIAGTLQSLSPTHIGTREKEKTAEMNRPKLP